MRPLALVPLLVAACWAGPNEDLIDAARRGDLAAVEKLLAHAPAPDIEAKTPYGQTPLYVAAMNGHEPVVKLLLAKGAKTAVTDTFYKAPMLTFVLVRKHYGIAGMILDKGGLAADETLEQVAMSGTPELLEKVLAMKPAQAALDKNYEMLLARNRPQMAELLLKAGAKPPAPGFTVEAKTLESYAGSYKSETLPLEIKVFVKDGKLFLQATGQPEFAPKAKSATVFEFAPIRLEVEFTSADAFTLRQAGQTFQYKKVVAQ